MSTAKTRFDGFNIHGTSYKRVGNHDIAVYVLVPKDIKPGHYPVVVKFHGGGLVHGDAIYPDWFTGWVINFIHRNNAIAILPNYRLIPEHTGKDIMEDLRDFWKWFNTDLSHYVASKAPGIELNFDRLLVSGDSAGGLLALQSAITEPELKIKAVLCQYPMTDYLNRKPQAIVNGKPAPGPEIIDEFVAKMQHGTVISSSIPTARTELSYALSAYGRWLEFYGDDKKLLPIYSVEDAAYLPPTLIIHGEQDDVVDVEDSRRFVEKVGKVLGAEVKKDVRLVTADGGHGFDTNAELTEEDADWLKKGLKWVEGKWLV